MNQSSDDVLILKWTNSFYWLLLLGFYARSSTEIFQ
jgi:hypothetical protein